MNVIFEVGFLSGAVSFHSQVVCSTYQHYRKIINIWNL